jgi:hypothetical protein
LFFWVGLLVVLGLAAVVVGWCVRGLDERQRERAEHPQI